MTRYTGTRYIRKYRMPAEHRPRRLAKQETSFHIHSFSARPAPTFSAVQVTADPQPRIEYATERGSNDFFPHTPLKTSTVYFLPRVLLSFVGTRAPCRDQTDQSSFGLPGVLSGTHPSLRHSPPPLRSWEISLDSIPSAFTSFPWLLPGNQYCASQKVGSKRHRLDGPLGIISCAGFHFQEWIRNPIFLGGSYSCARLPSRTSV